MKVRLSLNLLLYYGTTTNNIISTSIILVGIAVIVGFQSFHSKAVQSNRDAVIIDLNYLASDAQGYYRKTQTYGGGNQNFMGYGIPERLKANDNGNYSVLSTQPQKVTIEGVGKEREGVLGCGQSGFIAYRIIVEPTQTVLQKIN